MVVLLPTIYVKLSYCQQRILDMAGYIKDVKQFLNITIGGGSFGMAMTAINSSHTKSVALFSLFFFGLMLMSTYPDYRNDPKRKIEGLRSNWDILFHLSPSLFAYLFLFLVWMFPGFWKTVF